MGYALEFINFCVVNGLYDGCSLSLALYLTVIHSKAGYTFVRILYKLSGLFSVIFVLASFFFFFHLKHSFIYMELVYS